MSADNAAWLCPQHPFGHQWTGQLSCSMCGAKRSAADAILSGLSSARGWDKAGAESVLDAHRAEVLAEAIEAARAEHLKEDTGTPEDEAYNQGVDDAVAAIGALLEAAPAAAPVAVKTADDETGETEALRKAVALLARAAEVSAAGEFRPGIDFSIGFLKRLAEAGLPQGREDEQRTDHRVSYYIESRLPGSDTWERIGIRFSWQSREKADGKLAAIRERMPHYEHRLITSTTVVTDVPTEGGAS